MYDENDLTHLPSTIINQMYLQALSSSGLGHRPLTAGIAGSPEGTPLEESRSN